MNSPENFPSKISSAHLAKISYVYVRQSSLGQLKQNQESTDLQYQLVKRATALGWPPERVQIIDEDLGKSGSTAENRFGFQNLIAEIGLGKAGLVVSLDASRLARNNSDWYKLLELCSLFGVLIADCERLYDPRSYHDRLLLGLSGMMSEAELHHLKIRLQNGGRNKAARGDLRLPLPAGLARTRNDEIILNPDEEVQERIRLVFTKFRELNSARAVVLYLHQANLLLPIRPLLGPAPHEIEWRAATSALVLQTLKNPAYAGSYVYGRWTTDPTKRKPGRMRSGRIRLPIDQWPICLHDSHPGYISWEEFMANQTKLLNNLNHYEAGRRGVVRKGSALLQGIAFCGVCGRRMHLRYSGPQSNFPVYECSSDNFNEGKPRCQEIRALQVDAEIERIVLAALAPDQLALAIEALGQLEKEAETLKRQWMLKRERSRYETERARRQYDSVEPENRLVARSLERIWEEKLRKQEEIEQEFTRWEKEHQLTITDADRAEIIKLGQNLPQLWYDIRTTPQERKQIIRLVIKEATLDQKRSHGQVWIKILWQTGSITEHYIRRKVKNYENYAELEKLKSRILELNSENRMDAEIAEQLNSEGFVTAEGKPFNSCLIFLLRKKWGIKTVKINGKDFNPLQWPDGAYSIIGAAKILGINKSTVFKWLNNGILKGKQLKKGMPWKIYLSSEEIIKLKAKIRRPE